jgi:glycosyltransferase involved in cell wall biosynthesis
MSNGRKPRVFIGLREVAGVGRGLKAGFDALGIECVFLSLGYSPFQYQTENNPRWATALMAASQRVGRWFVGSWFRRILWIGLVQNLFAALAFPLAVWRYDTFIYCSIGSFFFFLELPLLKLLRKKVIFVFLGTDTRPVYLNGYVVGDTRRSTIRKGIALARVQKFIIGAIERFADVLINIPPQSHFHTRPIVSGYFVGLPAAYPRSESTGPSASDETVRILHAPSKPRPKGSDVIRQVMATLQDKGLRFEYREITGRPHAEVLREIQRSSFVIDELYSDTPLAGLATEAAFFGKPAVIGSYYWEQIREVLPPEAMPPSLFCHPDALAASVERLIVDRAFRERLGGEAALFVERNWSARRVAEKYLSLIDGSFPREWLFDPRDIHYLEGCGFSQAQARAVVAAFVQMGGRRALCLGDKPKLEAMFLASVEDKARPVAPVPGSELILPQPPR